MTEERWIPIMGAGTFELGDGRSVTIDRAALEACIDMSPLPLPVLLHGDRARRVGTIWRLRISGDVLEGLYDGPEPSDLLDGTPRFEPGFAKPAYMVRFDTRPGPAGPQVASMSFMRPENDL
jgi:hypothetical protein